MKNSARSGRVAVSADGRGLVSQAGAVLLCETLRVTGLAQVQLPADTDLHSVRLKLAHDLYYVRHVNPWLDLRLLVCTAFYAAGVPFALLSRLLRVPDGPTVEREMQGVVSEPPARARIAS